MAIIEQSLSITLIIFGATLFAIVYALRVLVVMERRIARMEGHIESITKAILEEEKKIESSLGRKSSSKKKKK
jgi:hypothetical protein